MSIVTIALVALIVLAVGLVAIGAVNLYASDPRSRAVQVVVLVIAVVYEAAGVVWAVGLFLVALIAQLLLVLRKRGAV